MSIEFNEKAYEQYAKKSSGPLNTRIRGADVSFFDALNEGRKMMESTPEGKNVLERLKQFGE
ncbi:MAG: hypothetical protein LBJ86_00250 [Spirochaetaceae bacterium]|nr:hypothetical protein [Spirochaetaceae bacterium]